MHVRSIFFLTLLLLAYLPGIGQLNLHINKQFFEGRKILKVETTWDDYVWVLGENNFIARISPTDAVEDFTSRFAAYSTKPFTDISARVSDTLVVATAGDYALLFTGGNIARYGEAEGMAEPVITSAVIPKQYDIQHPYTDHASEYGRMSLTTPNYFYGTDAALALTKPDPSAWVSRMLYRQNDRKLRTYTLFYGDTGLGGNCVGPEVSNFNLFVHHNGGTTLREVPMDVRSAAAGAIRTIYVSPRTSELPLGDDFAIFWAGRAGLNYLYNTRNCYARSSPISFFDDKQVNAISELHCLGALSDDYLSYMLIGTDRGLFVSNESQKQQFSNQYHNTILGVRAVHDMESTSDGIPIEVNSMYAHTPAVFCEKLLYVATDDGLFKLNYSIGTASYEHVGSTLYINGKPLDETEITTCGNGEDVLGMDHFYGDANNFIQWQRNGEDIIGADGHFVYLTQPGVYRAVMWFGCENLELYSKEITVTSADEPSYTFDPPETVDICAGGSYRLEARGGKPDYRYRWYRNGNLLDGETASALTVQETGSYRVGVSACGDNYFDSKPVNVRVHTVTKPALTTSRAVICQGESATLSIGDVPAGYFVTWFRDGVSIPGAVGGTLVTDLPGSYHAAWGISGVCTETSDRVTLRIASPPLAVIGADGLLDGSVMLCEGTTTTLTARHPASGTYTYRWSTGETGRSINVQTPGTYTLTLVNDAGCTDEASVAVGMHRPMATPEIPDTVICLAKGEIIKMAAPLGYAVYEWSGGKKHGTVEVELTQPGTYTLRVQDENGCEATTSFTLRVYCPEVIIPNMFSPNGDGVNDSWAIAGLEDDPGAIVQVFDRNGREVFSTRGQGTPWNGLFNGRPVPVGAYYYSIRTTRGELYKGSVTVLY